MNRSQGWPIAAAGFIVGFAAHLLSQHVLAIAAMLLGILGLAGIWSLRASARRARRRVEVIETAGRLERRLELHIALLHSRHPLAGPHTAHVSETEYLPVVRRAAARS